MVAPTKEEVAVRQCQACGFKLTPDNKFCGHCGTPVAINLFSATPAELIARSAPLDPKQLGDALLACALYVGKFEKGSAVEDMKRTASLISTLEELTSWARGEEPKPRDPDLDVEWAERWSTAPEVLCNGVLTVARLREGDASKRLLAWVSEAQQLDAGILQVHVDAATKEAESLMPNGQSGAQREHVTIEQAYKEAEIYYNAYERGELDAAVKGFLHLKALNPLDAYFRNLLGCTLERRGRRREALQEYLFSMHLDPCEPQVTQNLMRSLTQQSLFRAAFEIWRHYLAHRRLETPVEAEEVIMAYGAYAAHIVCAQASLVTGVRRQQADSMAPDLLAHVVIPDRPWLKLPAPSGSFAEDPLSHKSFFISYRHADAAEIARMLEERLQLEHPGLRVFLDASDMRGGTDFTEQLRAEIEKATAVILLIGPSWSQADGLSRLHDPRDVLRREMAYCSKKGVPCIPVLIDGGRMPAKEALPEALAGIPEIHALNLRKDHFTDDMLALTGALYNMVRARAVIEERKKEETKQTVARLSKGLREAGGDMSKLPPDILDLLQQLPRFRAMKAAPGVGVPEKGTPVEGTWEIKVRGPATSQDLHILVSEFGGPEFTGEVRRADATDQDDGQAMSGTWTKLIDPEAHMLLGLELEYVDSSGSPIKLVIPFDRIMGDTYIGEDDSGVRYASRNIEPRPHGF